MCHYHLEADHSSSSRTYSRISSKLVSKDETEFSVTVSSSDDRITKIIAADGIPNELEGGNRIQAPAAESLKPIPGTPEDLPDLVLSGQVYTIDGNPFEGTLNISGVYDDDNVINIGTGGITNGVLNYTIGTPSNNLLKSIKDFDPDVTVSDESVKLFSFSELKLDSEEFDSLFYGAITLDDYGQLRSGATLSYVYVDGDVTVSFEETDEDGYTIVGSVSYKKGWNLPVEIEIEEQSGIKVIYGFFVM